MKNHYVLPVCFAAAAHGALLFGFTKNPRSLTVKNEIIPIPIFAIPNVVEEPPVVVENDQRDTAAKPAPDVPQLPRSAEPLTIEMDNRPTMTAPPLQTEGLKDVIKLFDDSFGKPGGKGASPFGDVMSGIDLDNPPRTRFQATPVFPFEAKRSGMSGEVHVEFIVNESGRVTEPKVVKSSHHLFDEPTLRAVAKWQFEPGRRGGRIVRFRMTVPVVFNLNE
jgi:periplasmic protein TonB